MRRACKQSFTTTPRGCCTVRRLASALPSLAVDGLQNSKICMCVQPTGPGKNDKNGAMNSVTRT